MKKYLLLAIAACCCEYALATVRNVPAAYITIQSALNACIAGDTVLVQPGTYIENITWPSVNGIKLLSAGDSSNTIIDAGGMGRVIAINVIGTVIDTNTLIRGFRITNGLMLVSHADGGGIYLSNASPRLENLDISENHIATPTWNWAYGAGIHCYNSNAIIRNTVVRNNSIDSAAWGFGAGIYLDQSSPQLHDVIISGNSTTSDSWCYGVGLHVTYNSSPVLTNVKVLNNVSKSGALWYYGAGVYVNQSSISMANVLIAQNAMGISGSFYYGGGIYLRDSSSAVLMNVTISENKKTDNTAITGSGIYADNSTLSVTNSICWNTNTGAEISSSTSAASVNYSCIRNGFTGTSNISTSPLFVSASDFHLTQNSPCINAGTLAGSPLFDLDNNLRPLPALTNPDMGCYELNQGGVFVAELYEENSFALSVFPNPANESVTIKHGSTCMQGGLRIFDATGRMVHQSAFKGNSHVLDITSFANGMYSIVVNNETTASHARLVKQ